MTAIQKDWPTTAKKHLTTGSIFTMFGIVAHSGIQAITPKGLRSLVLILGCLGAGEVCALEANNPLTPHALLDRLKSDKSGRLDYKEMRQLPEMSRPIKASGSLEFHPPDYLAKHVHHPHAADYLIEGRRLTIREGASGETLEMDVTEIPPLQVLSETLQAIFSGGPHRIEELWTLHLGGSWNRWKLVLTPNNHHKTLAIREIQIEGQNTRLDRITIQEAEGAIDTLEFQ